jgi:hypothetical protein
LPERISCDNGVGVRITAAKKKFKAVLSPTNCDSRMKATMYPFGMWR